MPRQEHSECHWIPGPFLPSVRRISEAISYRLARKGGSSDRVPSQGKFAALVLESLTTAHERLDDGVDDFYNWVAQSGSWKLHLTPDDFNKTWAPAPDRRGEQGTPQPGRGGGGQHTETLGYSNCKVVGCRSQTFSHLHHTLHLCLIINQPHVSIHNLLLDPRSYTNTAPPPP
jgi:hypothetical protein